MLHAMRVYIPTTLAGLADAYKAGELGPAPLDAFAVTVAVTLSLHGRMVEIAVEDNGKGIPAARREEAFRPFHRLDEGRNLQVGGSGLGLAIARDIARAHGGELMLGDSALGGLKATIRLPV